MNKNLDKQLAQVFENDYPGYECFVEKVINVIFTGDDTYEAFQSAEDLMRDEKRRNKANESGIQKILKVGEINTPEPIEVFDITLKDDKDLQYNRVGIQSFIRSELFVFTNAFMLFHNENPEGKDWRFSFAYKDTTIKGMTSAKRYTYLFGKNHRARTASERFAKLADAEKDTQNLLNAFSVEALSNEFFEKYRVIYANFVQYITGKRIVKNGGKWETKQIHEPNKTLYGAFGNDDKRIRDYIKKLMGRITFLYFVQKKGWLNHNPNFLSNMFDMSNYKHDFLDCELEPFFYTALNTDIPYRKNVFDEHNRNLGKGDVKWDSKLLDKWNDIPFLNGGLFERDENDSVRSVFPEQFFKNRKDGIENYDENFVYKVPNVDKGYGWDRIPGLFDFFDQYNFTIDENDPNDAEVSVDPEMLGKIFENLLEDNKDKGAYYTHKEIVQYMCKESIIAYLVTEAKKKSSKKNEDYEDFARSFANNPYEIAEKIKNKKATKQLVDIDDSLKDVKICDPAIGSGAFPMGMLNELVACREAINNALGNDISRAELKKHIIQNNIYGVDIEKGAVDIARLRFWLALVVDEDEPQPLPNLDYKIMCGNSQICRFKLDMPINEVFEEYNRVGKENAKKNNSVWNNFSLNDYRELVIDYADEYNNKSSLKSKINDIKNCFKTTLAKGDINKRKQIEKKVNDYESVTLFGKRKADEDPSGYANAKAILRRQKEKESEILNNKKYENSFEWRFEYPQLLDNDGNFIGFDIVLANPPYIKEGRMSKLFFEPYKDSPYYKGKMDIWYLFACNGLDLLNDKGVLCFIATNNWVTSFGASKLRNKVIKETRICNIVDFGAVMMFESASIQTMIMLFQKDSITDDYSFDYRRLTAYRATEKDAAAILSKTATEAEYFSPTIHRANFIDKNITFSRSADILGLMEMVDGSIHLYDEEIAQGIVPNPDIINSRNIKNIPSDEILLNDIKVGDGVFVVDEGKFLGLNETESKYLKNLYEPTNCHKFYFDGHTTKKIIYITKQNYNHDAPTLLNHLSKYRYVMEQRRENQNGRLEYYHLHWPRIESYFKSGEKILVPRKSTIPIFTYTAKEAYVMMAINIIKTNRVNMKYLTGLLNSKLIEFWLKNKGKMQGANYQLDKEPLMQIPIVVPNRETQELVARLVDYIIYLSDSNNLEIFSHTSNKRISFHVEEILDMVIYELYFEQHMKNNQINVVSFLNTYKWDNGQKDIQKEIESFYLWYQQSENPIRQRVMLLETRSKYLIYPIHTSYTL